LCKNEKRVKGYKKLVKNKEKLRFVVNELFFRKKGYLKKKSGK